jgi:hypothetical protein
MAEPKLPEFCLSWVDPHWSTCMTKSEWASWVEAVGSIIGIVVAILVVRHQLSKTRQAEHQRTADKLEALATLIEEAENCVNKLPHDHDQYDVLGSIHEALKHRLASDNAVNQIEVLALVGASTELGSVLKYQPVVGFDIHSDKLKAWRVGLKAAAGGYRALR